MFNRFIYFVCIVVLHIGCTNVENNCYNVDLAGAVHNVVDLNLSDYATSIDYIPIGLQDSVLLTDVAYNRFYVDNEHIFVVAPGLETIYMFDKTGKFIKSVGKRGRAKGEYYVTRGIVSDSDAGILVVQGGREVVIYSLEDGECVGDFEFDSLFDKTDDIVLIGKGGQKQILSNMVIKDIVLKNNEFYLTVANNQSQEQFLLIVDMDMSVKSMVEIRKTEARNYFNRVLASDFHLFNDEINVFHGLKDTVYALADGILTPRISVNYGNFQTLETQDSRKRANESMQVAAGYPFMESASMIAGTVYLPASHVVYRNGSQYSNFVFDKNKRKTFVLDYSQEFDMAGLINDIDGGMPFWPQKLKGNKMYSFVDAGKFIDMSSKCNSAKMKEIASSLTYESNPVLIEVTLK